MSLSPQAQTILEHLQHQGSITGVEAEALYRVRHLPRRIKDLTEAGYQIDGVWKTDPTKQRYKRYVYKGERGYTTLSEFIRELQQLEADGHGKCLVSSNRYDQEMASPTDGNDLLIAKAGSHLCPSVIGELGMTEFTTIIHIGD